MFSINLSRFNGLFLALIISVISSVGAFALADAGQSRAMLAEAQAPVEASQPAPIGETWQRTELYFGTTKPDGTVVTTQEFEDFVDEIVTPRFPDGLTLLTGDGQWRDSSGTVIEEESNVLILLYPLDDKDANSEIEQIRASYKDAFQQESVLRVDDYSRVSF